MRGGNRPSVTVFHNLECHFGTTIRRKKSSPAFPRPPATRIAVNNVAKTYAESINNVAKTDAESINNVAGRMPESINNVGGTYAESINNGETLAESSLPFRNDDYFNFSYNREYSSRPASLHYAASKSFIIENPNKNSDY